MPDHQRVIEFLRDVRQNGAATLQAAGAVTPEVTQMATDYAALCTQANDRLRQCSVFLQQGLRTEAIHLAEEPPNLLDLVAQLDLPDPQAWAEFCVNNGLPVPPPLQLDRAGQLNEAYSEDQPLETLLSRHRLLALSRAPVLERLQVMRQIQQMDAGTPYWEKDIRQFEKSRLKELPVEFYAAVKRHDHDAIADLMKEVTQEKWFEPVPADLTAAVSDAYGRIQRTAVEAKLRNLVEPLRDAFAARSLPECQALVQQWKNAMAAGGVTSISPDLLDEIKPVVAFVTEQTKREELARRYKESCRNFAKLLDADAPDAQLEAGYARLKEFNEPIPSELTERYQAKTAHRRKAADQRHRTRLVGIATSAAAVIVIGLVIVMLVMRSSAAQQWASRIHSAVAEHTADGLARAQHYVDDLSKSNPGMLTQPVVAKEINDLKTQQEQFAADQATIQKRIATLQAAGTAAAGVIAKQDATFSEIRAAASTLQSAIDEAKSGDLSWADSNGKLPAAIDAVQSAVSTLRDRVTASVEQELEGIAGDLRKIPETAATPEIAAQSAEQINRLQGRIAPLRDAPLMDDKTKGDVVALADQISQRQQGALSTSGVAGELQNIRTHANSAPALRDALNQFIARYPNDVHAADFKQALDRIAPALALEAWSQLTASFDGKFNASTVMATQKRLEAVTAFQTAHPDAPVAAAVAQYVEYLHRAIDAMGEKGPWQTGLSDLLATPLLTDLSYMEVSDGRRYYTLGDPKRVERKFNNQVSIAFDSVNVKDYTQRIPVVIDPPLTVSPAPVPAPHTKVVAEIADSLKVINDANWETFGIDLVDQLLHNDKIDPVVKVILIEQTLKTQVIVTPSLADAYDRPLSEMERQTPEQLPWLDPARITEGTKRALKQALDAIPPAAEMKKKLAAADAALFGSLKFDVAGTGVLLKDDAGKWSLSTAAAPVEGSKIWLIVLAPGTAGPAAPAPPPAPATPATATAPTTSAATAPAAAAEPAAAASAPSAPAPPEVTASLSLIGGVSGNKFVLNTVPATPQGSIVYITRP